MQTTDHNSEDRLGSIESMLKQLLSIQQVRPVVESLSVIETLQVRAEDRALLDAYRDLPFAEFKKLHNRTMAERLKRMNHVG